VYDRSVCKVACRPAPNRSFWGSSGSQTVQGAVYRVMSMIRAQIDREFTILSCQSNGTLRYEPRNRRDLSLEVCACLFTRPGRVSSEAAPRVSRNALPVSRRSSAGSRRTEQGGYCLFTFVRRGGYRRPASTQRNAICHAIERVEKLAPNRMIAPVLYASFIEFCLLTGKVNVAPIRELFSLSSL
jgi:hypothetical protein